MVAAWVSVLVWAPEAGVSVFQPAQTRVRAVKKATVPPIQKPRWMREPADHISGRDTTLTGAQAGGETVKVDAGRHLTLTSEQDSDRL